MLLGLRLDAPAFWGLTDAMARTLVAWASNTVLPNPEYAQAYRVFAPVAYPRQGAHRGQASGLIYLVDFKTPALLDFAAPGQDQMDGFAQMQTDLNLINALSTTLGAEPGTNVAISVGNGATQTSNASTGNLVNGSRVFTVTSFSVVNGSTLNGSPTDQVVLNPNIGDVYFGREIDLSGMWDGDITASPVPEPGMFGPLSAFATGLVSLGALVRTRRWLRRWK